MTNRILIFSIAIFADYSFYVKFIATCSPTFFGYIISVLAMVSNLKRYLMSKLNAAYTPDNLRTRQKISRT